MTIFFLIIGFLFGSFSAGFALAAGAGVTISFLAYAGAGGLGGGLAVLALLLRSAPPDPPNPLFAGAQPT